MDTITLANHAFNGVTLHFEHSTLLVIQAPHGFLGCGYLSLAAADKFGEAAAIVTGVSNYDEMLQAPVKAVSAAAQARGIAVGMPGREALQRMI